MNYEIRCDETKDLVKLLAVAYSTFCFFRISELDNTADINACKGTLSAVAFFQKKLGVEVMSPEVIARKSEYLNKLEVDISEY